MKNMINQRELTTVSAGANSGHLYHLVGPGDTLSGLAMYYGTTVKHLLYLNPRITNPDLIYDGEMIRVR